MTLKIFLLGQFNLRVNDQPLNLPSRPAQSLLAYLVINAGMEQRREKLAGLLWPEATETNARSYLRQALWRLRKALESSSPDSDDRFLDINDISVTFRNDATYWLDVADFLSPGRTAAPDDLLSAVALYKGELLPGFYDEWIFPERDRLQAAYHQKMGELLEGLLGSERWTDAVRWSEQWIRLSHSSEAAFRALLRAYAGLGDRGMAHSTYKRCVEAMDRELAIEPSTETQQLYESILLGQHDPAPTAPGRALDQKVSRPPFLDAGGGQESERPLFVAREDELAQLEGFLNRTLDGKGQVIFVTGEAGSGKTTLIQEFAHYALDTHPVLVVAAGNCNAHTGIGDPYLPFREILELLAGDVESQWVAGAISSDHALRLWNVLPITSEALVETGPDLINTFIPGDGLARRAEAYQTGAVWKARLLDLVKRKAADPEIWNLQQAALFEQVTRVLRAISRRVPFVLIVDDLQWADPGSISLLFHLGRQLAGSRILLIGAYRPEEITIGRDGERHPLASVAREFQRIYGDLIVDLDVAERSSFVEAVVDSEPNRLGTSFRQLLFRQTNGHPLFIAELLRGLQERGDLQRDTDGRWVEGPSLDWEKQPARVEAVVAERVGRLAQPLREALRVASVEGELFTAEIVAQIRGCTEKEMLEYLSGDLDRRHHLVRAHTIIRMDGRLLSRYRFRHIQIQKYLYSSLDDVERVHLHERVGSILENLYGGGDEASAIAPQLARHFQEAGITTKAIRYLQQAGERALQLSAYQEAIVHLSNSLSLLDTQPESGDRTALEVDLQLALGRAWLSRGFPAAEVDVAYVRARDLGRQLGLISQLCIAIGGLAILNYVRGQHHQARDFAQEALSIAQKEQQPEMELLGHWYLGLTLFALGDFTAARASFIRAIDAYDPQEHHHVLVAIRGTDGGLSAIAYDACCLWCLGFPDQAFKRSEEVFALARKLGHFYTLEDVLCYAGGMLNVMRRDGPALKKNAEEMIELARANNLVGWMRIATSLHGEALAMLGDTDEGIALMNAGLVEKIGSGEYIDLPGRYCSLAETYLRLGQLVEAEAALSEAFRWLNATDERVWEAELHRIQAEWFVATGRESDAQASFDRALETARRQEAKSWELRTALSLARFMQRQGRVIEARRMLEDVYNWFSEGFDTPDLVTARALLVELA